MVRVGRAGPPVNPVPWRLARRPPLTIIERGPHRPEGGDMADAGVLVPLRDMGRRVAAYATVDPRSQWVTRYPWFRLTSDGPPLTFAHPGAGGRPVTMAEVVLEIVGQDGVAAEHRNGDPLDNRRSNLRAVPAEPASAEAPGRRRSAYRGVLWDPGHESWVAYGFSGGTYVHLGRFDDEQAAARAAREWAVENQSIHLEDDHAVGGFGRALGPPRQRARDEE
jgi:hypothetical protein